MADPANTINLSRRLFLRGEFAAPAAPPKPIARIGAACVARANNEVCRACGEACPEQAIRFRPQVMAAALPEVLADRCTACEACLAPCPTQAIRIE